MKYALPCQVEKKKKEMKAKPVEDVFSPSLWIFSYVYNYLFRKWSWTTMRSREEHDKLELDDKFM